MKNLIWIMYFFENKKFLLNILEQYHGVGIFAAAL